MSGTSGKLKTTLIGDYLNHQDLTELEEERVTYHQALAEANDVKSLESQKAPKKQEKGKIEAVEKQLIKLKEEYVPIDFNAYTIND